MKSIKNVVFAGLLIAPTAAAQTTLTAGDSTDPWLGFVNVFELDCVNFAFQSAWGLPELTATFDDGAGTITMEAATVNDPAPFWYIGGGMPGAPGNKCMDATLYNQVDDDSLAGQMVTFTGTVLSNTLTGPHIAEIFIRDFEPDFSGFGEISIAVTPGPFSISYMTNPGLGRHIQYGFQMIGPNAWPGDEGAFGSIVLGTGFPGATFNENCFGDGGNQMGCTDCPCSNNAPMGSGGGCLNSSGSGSRLMASGNTSVSLPMTTGDDLRFEATGGPAFQLFILNSGDALAPTNPANPCFGLGSGAAGLAFDGLRCAVSNTLRNGGRGADSNGEIGITNAGWGGSDNPPGGIAQFFGYSSGATKYFQCIHRDSAAVNCLTGLNTTQAIEVTFTP